MFFEGIIGLGDSGDVIVIFWDNKLVLFGMVLWWEFEGDVK